MYQWETNVYFKRVKYVIEIQVFFVKQVSEKWNVGFELWKSDYKKWNSVVSFVKLTLWTCVVVYFKRVKYVIWKMCNLKVFLLWIKLVKSEKLVLDYVIVTMESEIVMYFDMCNIRLNFNVLKKSKIDLILKVLAQGVQI